MGAIVYISLLLCIAGVLMSLISIFAFFLGTGAAEIWPFVWAQLALAGVLAVAWPVSTRPLIERFGSLYKAVRATPGWLQVALLVVVLLMLLGELSVLVAWLKAHEITAYLNHLPSLCIIFFCATFWLHCMALQTRDAGSP